MVEFEFVVFCVNLYVLMVVEFFLMGFGLVEFVLVVVFLVCSYIFLDGVLNVGFLFVLGVFYFGEVEFVFGLGSFVGWQVVVEVGEVFVFEYYQISVYCGGEVVIVGY